MMNYYEIAKSMVDIVDVAENLLHIKVKSGKALCPFHNDVNNPSLKLWHNGTFKCFACGAKGDMFDLVGGMENLLNYEALARINDHYHLQLPLDNAPDPSAVQIAELGRDQKRDIKKLVDLTALTYAKYFRLLRVWREIYPPKSMEEELDRRFVASLTEFDYVEYVCEEVFMSSDFDIKRKYALTHKKKLAKILQLLKEGEKDEQAYSKRFTAAGIRTPMGKEEASTPREDNIPGEPQCNYQKGA